MPNDFSLTELRLVQSLVCKKKYQDIADLIDRPVEEVTELIEKMASQKNIVSYQQQFDNKVKEKKQKSDSIKRIRLKNVNADKEQRSKLIEKHKNQKILQQQEVARRKRAEPLFQTRSVDYSQLITIRIDRRTII